MCLRGGPVVRVCRGRDEASNAPQLRRQLLYVTPQPRASRRSVPCMRASKTWMREIGRGATGGGAGAVGVFARDAARWPTWTAVRGGGSRCRSWVPHSKRVPERFPA
ncbi:hypothetical protein SAMN05216252_1214 [Actinacidiphila glaucinigra]|uniref:Uncharacterized protein n=1 Tax=Actinacidiphila glaucinigra TaxID=235986 RepID=A0A239LRF3_9ACTN|nr:hypothetical protein SAMN05216252_1214 [Actinacidiphila glaucinigra]